MQNGQTADRCRRAALGDSAGRLKAWNALAQDYIGGTNKGSKGNTFKTS